MTTPKELADKAKQQIEVAQDAWHDYKAALSIDVQGEIVKATNAHNRAETELHAAIDQLQAMAEARQGSGEPVENVAEDVYDQLADMISPHVTDTADGLPGSVVGAFTVLLDHWKLTRSAAATPPSAQQATGSGQVLTKALDLLKQATRYTCSRERWSSDLTEEIAVFLSEHTALAAATQAQPEVEALYREVGRKMVEITTTVRDPDEWLCIPELWLQCMQERDEALRKLAAPTTGKREPLTERVINAAIAWETGSITSPLPGACIELRDAVIAYRNAHGITGEQR